MSERIEIEGVSLTADECREVLAWVAEPWRPLPTFIGWNDQREKYLRRESLGVYLTPAIIEKIRDEVEPWQEVRRDEVEPWEVFKMPGTGVAYLAGQGIDDAARCADWCRDDARWARVHPAQPVLVRRPRKEAPMTLGEVEPGQRFRFCDDRQADCIRTRSGYLSTLTWHAINLGEGVHRDAPIELVPEDDR